MALFAEGFIDDFMSGNLPWYFFVIMAAILAGLVVLLLYLRKQQDND